MAFQNKEYLKEIHTTFPEASFRSSIKYTDDSFACSVTTGFSTENEHFHDHIELIYVVASGIKATINKQEYDLSSGDLLVIIPGDVHSYTTNENSKIISIESSSNFLFSQILTNTDLHYSMPYMLSKIEGARVFKADVIDDTNIPKDIYSVVEEYTNKNNFYKLAIRGYLTNIALFVFRRWDALKNATRNLETDKDKSGVNRLSGVLKAIDENYMKDISVAEMAKVAGMSYSFFSRFFKSTMKLTFSEYLNSIRIQEAEKLLIDSDLSISEIGEAVGFSNTSYFIAQFKKQLHITPKKYKSKFGQ